MLYRLPPRLMPKMPLFADMPAPYCRAAKTFSNTFVGASIGLGFVALVREKFETPGSLFWAFIGIVVFRLYWNMTAELSNLDQDKS